MFAREMQIATDVVGLIDEWAARFFEELDYINEGENATKFAEQMRVDLPQVRNYTLLWLSQYCEWICICESFYWPIPLI